MRRRLFALVLLLCGVLAAGGGAPGLAAHVAAAGPGAQVAPLSPPVTVRVGVQGSAANAPIYIGYDRGYFQQEGLNLDLVNLPSANELIPALAASQIEVASGGIAAGLFNAFARGIDLKIVADSASMPPGERGSAWVVRQDLLDSSAIRTPADLRGRTIALGAAASIADVELDVLLAQGGLTRGDVRLEQIPYADQRAAFANGSIDAAYTFEPFLASLTSNRLAGVLRWTSELVPYQAVSVLMYRAGFTGEAANRFMIGYLRGIRDFNAAFDNRPVDDGVVAILVQHTTVKDPAAWQIARPAPINPNGYTYPENIQRTQDYFVANNIVPQRVDLSRAIDTSYVEYALDRLGRVESATP
ncbi:MAG TPA: ABC transporter substrate-binding protein [Chloroflexota bacterium]|jgi:NitT/TauT family transport system substrate-binding protein